MTINRYRTRRAVIRAAAVRQKPTIKEKIKQCTPRISLQANQGDLSSSDSDKSFNELLDKVWSNITSEQDCCHKSITEPLINIKQM